MALDLNAIALNYHMNGYSLVRVKEGTKQPYEPVWQNRTFTAEQIRDSWGGDSVGFLAADTPAIDLDIRDPKVSDIVSKTIAENIGRIPCRIGQAPKKLFVYWSDTPHTKWSSKKYRTVGTEKETHQVEFLGAGQQYLVAGIHPDTQKPYEWIEPLCSIDDLPAIELVQLEQIRDSFEEIAEAKVNAGEWEVLVKGSNANAVSKELIEANRKEPLSMSDTEVRAYLDEYAGLVDGNDRDVVCQLGMALWHQFHGHKTGMALFLGWAAKFDKFNDNPGYWECRWRGFQPDYFSPAKTFSTVVWTVNENRREQEQEHGKQLAIESQDAFSRFSELIQESPSKKVLLEEVCPEIAVTWVEMYDREILVAQVQAKLTELTQVKPSKSVVTSLLAYKRVTKDEMPEECKPWVYVEKKKMFHNTNTAAELEEVSFNRRHNRLFGEDQNAANECTRNLGMPTFYDVHFAPQLPLDFERNGEKYLNSYKDLRVPLPLGSVSPRQREAINRFIKHTHLLFGYGVEQKAVLDFFFVCVTMPGVKIPWMLLVLGIEGDGKSFFNEMMNWIMGHDHSVVVENDQLAEKHNGWLENKLWGFVEEIYLDGSSKYMVLNKLKPIVSNMMIAVRSMNTDTRSVPSCINIMAATNFPDAIPTKDGDRRNCVVETRFTNELLKRFSRRFPDYYRTLYELMRECPEAIRYYFENEHVMSDDFPIDGRAPIFEAKKRMVVNSRSTYEEAIDEWMEENPLYQALGVVDLTSMAQDVIKEVGDGKPLNTVAQIIRKSLCNQHQMYLIGQKPIKIKGVKRRFYRKKGAKKSESLVEKMIRDYYNAADETIAKAFRVK